MLADKYHVVAPDFPGYGASSAPQEVCAVLMTDVVQHTDVRMLKLRDDLGFALKAGT
jgi:pimeloyl-ACP methyl ester carboxylesterase